MATATSMKTICVVCNKEMRTYLCDGCSQRFCRKHLDEHHNDLARQFDGLEMHHDELRARIIQQREDGKQHRIMNEIERWESESIEKIKQIADQCRERLIKYIDWFCLRMEKKLSILARDMRERRHENEFNDLDLDQLKQKLKEIETNILQPMDMIIEKQPTSFISSISLRTPLDTRWKQVGRTIAGKDGEGNRLDQLAFPTSICIDNQDQTIYIADRGNTRIVEWKANATSGQVVFSGNGQPNSLDRLNEPVDVIMDPDTNSLIIADPGNRQLLRWFRQTNRKEIILSNIHCFGLAIDKDASLYMSDHMTHEVRRWKKGEATSTIVAGGHGQGNALNQLNTPSSIFVDQDYNLYVSDRYNHRVMKWTKDAKEGMIVVGGNGDGDSRTQLSYPRGLIVDRFGQIYVADWGNDRVIRWCEDGKEGTIVVGSGGTGEQAHQLSGPTDFLFDAQGDLYVVDCNNARVQKFQIDKINK